MTHKLRAAYIAAAPLPALGRGVRFAGAGVLMCLLIAIGIWGYDRVWNRLTPDSIEPPVCYGADNAYVPGNEVIPLRGAPGERGTPSIDRRHDLTYHERLKQAEEVCKPASCDRAAWETYRSALFWYLSARLQHTRKLDMNYGQPGLRRAQEIYSTPDDLRFERALRERYAAKAFLIKDFTQNRDAVAILVLKGAAGLRPCRKADL